MIHSKVWNLRQVASRHRGAFGAVALLTLWRLYLLPSTFGNLAEIAPSLCQAPCYLAAAIIFLMQTAAWSIGWFHLRTVQLSEKGVLVAWLQHLRDGLFSGVLMSIFSAAYYSYSYFSDWTTFVGNDQNDVRLMGRYFLWFASVPTQWVIFVKFFSSADSVQSPRLFLAVAAMPMCGAWAAEAASTGMLWTSLFAGVLSTLCMLTVFRHTFALPLEAAMESTASKIRFWVLLTWTLYPAAHFGRQFGLISVWTEQVLAYTVLDVCSKTVTLSAFFCDQVLRMIFLCVQQRDLQQEHGNSSYNRNLVVTMSVNTWRVVSVRNHPCSTPTDLPTPTDLVDLLHSQPPLQEGGLLGISVEELLPDPSQVALLKSACSNESCHSLGSKNPVTIVAARDIHGSHSTFRFNLGCPLKDQHLLEIELIMGAHPGEGV